MKTLDQYLKPLETAVIDRRYSGASGSPQTSVLTQVRVERDLAAEPASEPEEAVTVGGETLTPNGGRGYVVMQLCHAWPSVTAYGTALHPRTIAACYGSLKGQVFNLGHRMKSYLTPEQLRALPAGEQRDMMLGSIQAVEFPPAPAGGWQLSRESPPCIRAAASFSKACEAANALARHGDRWSVSQEIHFTLADSGFLILEPGRLAGESAALVARTTPAEAQCLALGYVPCTEAPDDLLACYDAATARVSGAWQGSPVVLLKGGLGGQVEWFGVGYVQVPAEREARIERILAEHPDAAAAAALAEFFATCEKSSRKGLTLTPECFGPSVCPTL